MKLPDHAHRFLLLIGVFLVCTLPSPVFASISECSASVDTSSVPSETTNSISFSVTNNTDNGEGVSWIKLTAPSGNFTLAGSPSSPGWSNSFDGSSMTMTGGSVEPGASYSFSIQVTSANVTAGSANWGISVAADGSGSDNVSCSGSLGTAITGGGGDHSAPNMTGLSVVDIGANSARVTWTTDESATAVIQYGTTGDYGVTKTDTSLSTSHSISIDGLAPNTTYHYSVQSTDAGGNTSDTGENTFVTNATTATTTTTSTGTVQNVYVTVAPSPTPVPDRIGPTVSVSTKFQKTYTEPPEISGGASDPSGVVDVQYSLDGGINFLPIDTIKSLGKTSVTFSFVPYQSDDGNYSLVFRATDAKGNVSTRKSTSYVIDRLPPQFGASVVIFGSQVLEPVGGAIRVIANTDYTIFTSIIGGPIEMRYVVENDKGEVADVIAQKNSDTGLWKALIHFDVPGVYRIYGSSVDGAENKTVDELMQIRVMESGKVTAVDGSPLSNAQGSIYSLDMATKKFSLWDGASYGQINPAPVSADGSYGFILPNGVYYLRAGAFGYKTAVSDIFSVNEISPVIQNVQLSRAFGIQIGDFLIPLFDFSQTTLVIDVSPKSKSTLVKDTDSLVGKEFPFFRFPFEGKPLTSLDLRGKPTLITLLNTWSPQSASQLAMLDSLSANTSINVLVIVPQESLALVSTFMKRGGYTTRIVADPDGNLVEGIQYRVSPTQVFVDRKGTIQSVRRGFMTKDQLISEIK